MTENLWQLLWFKHQHNTCTNIGSGSESSPESQSPCLHGWSAHRRPPGSQTDHGPAHRASRPTEFCPSPFHLPRGSMFPALFLLGVKLRMNLFLPRVPIYTSVTRESPSLHFCARDGCPRPREGDFSEGSPRASQPAPAASSKLTQGKISQRKTECQSFHQREIRQNYTQHQPREEQEMPVSLSDGRSEELETGMRSREHQVVWREGAQMGEKRQGKGNVQSPGRDS